MLKTPQSIATKLYITYHPKSIRGSLQKTERNFKGLNSNNSFSASEKRLQKKTIDPAWCYRTFRKGFFFWVALPGYTYITHLLSSWWPEIDPKEALSIVASGAYGLEWILPADMTSLSDQTNTLVQLQHQLALLVMPCTRWNVLRWKPRRSVSSWKLGMGLKVWKLSRTYSPLILLSEGHLPSKGKDESSDPWTLGYMTLADLLTTAYAH